MTYELTQAQRDELARLAEAATPGPWEYNKATLFACDILEWGNGDHPGPNGKYFNGVRTVPVERNSNAICGTWQDNDASFIAAANPQTIIALLSALRAIEQKCAKHERAVEKLAERLASRENGCDECYADPPGNPECCKQAAIAYAYAPATAQDAQGDANTQEGE